MFLSPPLNNSIDTQVRVFEDKLIKYINKK